MTHEQHQPGIMSFEANGFFVHSDAEGLRITFSTDPGAAEALAVVEGRQEHFLVRLGHVGVEMRSTFTAARETIRERHPRLARAAQRIGQLAAFTGIYPNAFSELKAFERSLQPGRPRTPRRVTAARQERYLQAHGVGSQNQLFIPRAPLPLTDEELYHPADGESFATQLRAIQGVGPEEPLLPATIVEAVMTSDGFSLGSVASLTQDTHYYAWLVSEGLKSDAVDSAAKAQLVREGLGGLVTIYDEVQTIAREGYEVNKRLAGDD